MGLERESRVQETRRGRWGPQAAPPESMQSPELSKDSETSTVVLESLKIILGKSGPRSQRRKAKKGQSLLNLLPIST